ncbi:MAG: metallophosphoesterase family protein [Chitinophagales bacterium]
MKKILIWPLCILVLFLSSCLKDNPNTHDFRGGKGNPGFGKELNIAIVSDIHYMDASLLKNNAAAGAAFQGYLDQDPKLIEYSDPIFRQCMSQIISAKPDIILIPGDLTKDGESVSHHSVIQLLREFQKAHIKVYVVPGNHDVNNPESAQYNGDNASPAPSISKNDFANMYSDFGYGNAIARDPHSLSYVNEIYPGVWILGLDACRYEDNQKIAIVGGRLKPETEAWALQWIKEAKKRHVAIFGMMHHGILEHYYGQNQLDPGYVIDDYESVAHDFTMAGLSIVFTGHYHANDITSRQDGDKTLYDIETGSMVTPPSPYRMISIRGPFMDISTEYIRHISAAIPGGLDFPTYSNLFLSNHLDGYIGYAISNPPYSLPNELVTIGAPLLRNGFMAHYAGDEKINAAEQARVDAFGQLVPPLGDALNALWTDLAPADNQLHLMIPSE